MYLRPGLGGETHQKRVAGEVGDDREPFFPLLFPDLFQKECELRDAGMARFPAPKNDALPRRISRTGRVENANELTIAFEPLSRGESHKKGLAPGVGHKVGVHWISGPMDFGQAFLFFRDRLIEEPSRSVGLDVSKWNDLHLELRGALRRPVWIIGHIEIGLSPQIPPRQQVELRAPDEKLQSTAGLFPQIEGKAEPDWPLAEIPVR